MIAVGIDPGITGAVAFIDVTSGKACVFDLPLHRAERRLDGLALALLMREHAPASVGGRVFLEKLHARAGGGGMQQMGSMMKSVGIIIGAIDCTRFPLIEVTPQTWKRSFGLIEAPSVFREKKTDSERKAGSLAVARRLYPSLEAELRRAKDDGRAEALLIAHYGLRKHA